MKLQLKHIITLALCLTAFITEAQIQIGGRAALHLSFDRASTIRLDDELDFLTYELRFLEEDISPSFSLFAIAENERAFVRLELGYRQITSRFSYIDYRKFDNLQSIIVRREIKSLYMPALMGFKINDLKLSAGPVVSFHFQDDKALQAIEDLEERNRRFDSGYLIGVSYRLNSLMIDLFYEQRFHGTAEGLYYRGDNIPFKQSGRYLSIGLSYVLDLNL